MSGFRKSGLFPLNPSIVDDRQLAPSKAFCSTPRPIDTETDTCDIEKSTDIDVHISPLFTSEQEALFVKRLEEGYDICTDSAYVAWLSIILR